MAQHVGPVGTFVRRFTDEVGTSPAGFVAPAILPPAILPPTDRKQHLVNTQIVIPLFPQFTALDGIGPYELLQRIPEFDITFIGHELGVVRSDNAMLGNEVDATFEQHPNPDIVVFPGGHGTRALMNDQRVLDWIRAAHETTAFTTSVCTGSLVLALPASSTA